MTVVGKVEEAGELKEFELPQEVLWIAVYKYQEAGGMWSTMGFHSKDKLMEWLRYRSTGPLHGVRIYSINL